MKKAAALILALAFLAGVSACGGTARLETPSGTAPEGDRPDKPASVELTVAAAASLKAPLDEVIENYASESPGVTVTASYGSSGALQTQIENGAPVDIFFSAATKQMDALDSAGLMVSDSIVKLLKNEIVLVIPAGSGLQVDGFEDAASDGVKRIALGDTASVPAGQYAKETFEFLNIWDNVSAKAVFGSDVKQVLSWVASGEADCGVVYRTDALSEQGVKIAAEAPDGSHRPVVYPVGIVKASGHKEEAADFISYLQSDKAMDVFLKYGFLAG